MVLTLVLAAACSGRVSAGINGPIDLYVVAGQSNAEASGDPGRTPDLPPGVGFEVSGGQILDLADPAVGSLSGSAWPAFARSVEARTDVPVAVVQTAVGGTTLLTHGISHTADGRNWSPDGGLRSRSVRATRSAIDTLTNAGWTPVLRGVLWIQGESDAEYHSGPADDLGRSYQAALLDLHDNYRSGLSVADLPMYIWRLGTRLDGDTVNFAAIRSGQEGAADARDGMDIVYRRASDFAELGWMRDVFHYTQDGYDDMGRLGAEAVVALRPNHAVTATSP